MWLGKADMFQCLWKQSRARTLTRSRLFDWLADDSVLLTKTYRGRRNGISQLYDQIIIKTGFFVSKALLCNGKPNKAPN